MAHQLDEQIALLLRAKLGSAPGDSFHMCVFAVRGSTAIDFQVPQSTGELPRLSAIGQRRGQQSVDFLIRKLPEARLQLLPPWL
jgi:hypothetical protein